MALEILNLIILTATLLCGLVLTFYAYKIRAAQARGLAFEDFRDGDQRRYRLETRHLQQAWQKELRNWLDDSRAILGKLHSIAAESSPHERDTRLAPALSSPASASPGFGPDTAPTRGSMPVSRERMSPGAPLPNAHRALAPPASAPVLAPAPARIAAGLGPRPRSATHLASHRARLTGAADSSPADTQAHFQATMPSMPSVKEPGSARPVPWIETKRVCHECDGGFVAVGNGGIGQCYACEGSGFIHAP